MIISAKSLAERQCRFQLTRGLRKVFGGLLIIVLVVGCIGNRQNNTLMNDVVEAYEKAQTSSENGNYRRAIQIFEMLRARFPFSDLSKQIQLDLIHAYYKSGLQEQAIDAADQFLRENPTDSRVDYALYMKGLAYFEDGPGFLERRFRRSIAGRPPVDAELSFSMFSRMVERYPASQYAQDARQRMVYLKNRLAAYENKVARYYLKTDAYVAALNRAKNAIETYNGADSNVESLEIMIEAYEGLGMVKLAEDTRLVLAQTLETTASLN